jgi:hypothetical protein
MDSCSLFYGHIRFQCFVNVRLKMRGVWRQECVISKTWTRHPHISKPKRVHTAYDSYVPFYVNSENSSSAERSADFDSGSLRRNKEERGTLRWRKLWWNVPRKCRSRPGRESERKNILKGAGIYDSIFDARNSLAPCYRKHQVKICVRASFWKGSLFTPWSVNHLTNI